MSDFEQRVDIIQVDLPESEYLHLFWVRGRQVNCNVTSIVVLAPSLESVRPCTLEDVITVTMREMTVVGKIDIAIFVIVFGVDCLPTFKCVSSFRPRLTCRKSVRRIRALPLGL